MFYYKAFGMTITSELKIEILPQCEAWEVSDIEISRGSLDAYLGIAEQSTENEWARWYSAPGRSFFSTEEGACFLIEDGKKITVDAPSEVKDALLSVYVLGSCMGRIFDQRGLWALHGSCVCKDGKAVLISGRSGAGKSTLAAEFIRRGWKIMTDDVALIASAEGTPVIRSSYPSQKLWQDTIDRYERPAEKLTPLWQEDRKDKYHVDVREVFYEGELPLTLMVNLYPTGSECYVERMKDVSMENVLAKAEQLMRNRYNFGFEDTQPGNRLFQKCVAVASRVNMAVALRAKDRFCCEEIYQKVCEMIQAR